MIETFENILSLLTSKDKNKKSSETSQVIKEGFSTFYKTLQTKINDIHQPQRNIPSGLQSSKFNLSSSNPFGASRHNRTEITDNLMYSPSNTRYSFDEELLESRHNFSIMPYKPISPIQKSNLSNNKLYKLISPKISSK